jgi:oxalate---CoA ligase
MFLPLASFGSINDLGLGLHWDASTLANEVARRANILTRTRIGRGAIVAIAHSGSAHFFADLLAVWQAGATAACLDDGLTQTEFETILSFTKPAALLVAAARPAGKPSVPIIDLTRDQRAASSGASGFALDDQALILFTSGTTGSPKGVVLTFRALLARLALNQAAIGRAPLASSLVTLPTHFGHGLIGNALTPLMAGGNIVLHPPGMTLASNLGRIVDEYGISFMSSVPALWPVAMKLSNAPARGSLTRIHIGSAPLSGQVWSDVASWTRAEVFNCYGTTETANWLAGASSIRNGIASGRVGRMWGGSVGVMDDNNEIRACGEGEIVVQTPSLMAGYLHRPDLTAMALRNGWFHTADRGAVDSSGTIQLTGRIKDEINRAGRKIQPAEIDALLERHPAVADACVFAIEDQIAGEIVAAAVKLADGANETAEGLRLWCRERLCREAVPERWFLVPEIPRNARGKVGRDAVRRHLLKTN